MNFLPPVDTFANALAVNAISKTEIANKEIDDFFIKYTFLIFSIQ